MRRRGKRERQGKGETKRRGNEEEEEGKRRRGGGGAQTMRRRRKAQTKRRRMKTTTRRRRRRPGSIRRKGIAPRAEPGGSALFLWFFFNYLPCTYTQPEGRTTSPPFEIYQYLA